MPLSGDEWMRIMAVDYGDVRTGVAISDPTGLLAGQTFVLRQTGARRLVQELAEVAAQHGVEELVVGYPKNMNDTLGPRAQKSAELAEALREATGLPVTLWDERRTTVDAHRILSETGNRGKKRKEKVDAVAASLILEGYLSLKRMGR